MLTRSHGATLSSGRNVGFACRIRRGFLTFCQDGQLEIIAPSRRHLGLIKRPTSGRTRTHSYENYLTRSPFHIMALPNFPSPSALSRTNRGSHRLNRTRAFNTGIAISCLFLLGHKPQPLWRFSAAKVMIMCSARANK